MQFHYVVFYDTDTQKWGVESDIYAYFPDGNIYDDGSAAQTGYGWFSPSSETPLEEALDEQLIRTLVYLVDTWPAPGVVANVSS